MKTQFGIRNIADGLTITDTPVVQIGYLTAINSAPGTTQFRSTVTNRGPMVDITNDLRPRMGIERIQIQQVQLVPGELGPNGELVYKPVNDKFDQFRYVGDLTNINGANGQFINMGTNSTTTFIEFSFIGTGANVLWLPDSSRDARVTIDGGAESANIFVSASTNLQGRNTSSNSITNLANGLTYGLHYVKLRIVVGTSIYGFEILNESTSIKTSPGAAIAAGQKRSLTATDTSAYNTTFEVGTLGTRGGRALVYMKNDGTIAKALTPTNGSSATLTSADHTNEEVIRAYNWREFGSGRISGTADDFSTLTSSTRDTLFTLDDNSTSLIAQTALQLLVSSNADYNLMRTSGSAKSVYFSFIGTGCDILRIDDASGAGGGVDQVTVSIDGGGTLNLNNTGSTTPRIERIVSGLPYGEHVLKFTTNAPSVYDIGFLQFIVWGPKKPTLPSGATELSDYNIVADYSSAAAGIPSLISQGVIRKVWSREMVYTGTWTSGAADVSLGSGFINTGSNAATCSYDFFGTDIEASFFLPASVQNITFSIDGNTNLSSFTTATLNNGGSGFSFTAATGVWTGTGGATYGNRVKISGLATGVKHTIKFTVNNANSPEFDYFDFHTPIHVHKNNGPFSIQSSLSIGSQGINDRRFFGNQLLKPMSHCVAGGVTGNPTTTSATLVPLIDMNITIKTSGRPIRISLGSAITNTTAGNLTEVQLYIDGIKHYLRLGTTAPVASYVLFPSATFDFPVPAGYHTIFATWSAGANTSTASGDRRNLTVEELPEDYS